MRFPLGCQVSSWEKRVTETETALKSSGKGAETLAAGTSPKRPTQAELVYLSRGITYNLVWM